MLAVSHCRYGDEHIVTLKYENFIKETKGTFLTPPKTLPIPMIRARPLQRKDEMENSNGILVVSSFWFHGYLATDVQYIQDVSLLFHQIFEPACIIAWAPVSKPLFLLVTGIQNIVNAGSENIFNLESGVRNALDAGFHNLTAF